MAESKKPESADSGFFALDGTDYSQQPSELARAILLKELNKGLRSRAQLARLLVKNEFEPELIEELLDRYVEVGLIDDVVYARALVNTRRKLKKISRSAIRRELLAAGVAEADFEEPLAALDQQSELELATSLALKKLRTMQQLDYLVQVRRISGYLGRRGFSAGVIGSAIHAARQQVN